MKISYKVDKYTHNYLIKPDGYYLCYNYYDEYFDNKTNNLQQQINWMNYDI